MRRCLLSMRCRLPKAMVDASKGSRADEAAGYLAELEKARHHRKEADDQLEAFQAAEREQVRTVLSSLCVRV